MLTTNQANIVNNEVNHNHNSNHNIGTGHRKS